MYDIQIIVYDKIFLFNVWLQEKLVDTPAFRYIVSQFKEHQVTSQKLCKGQNEVVMVGQTYLCMLESLRKAEVKYINSLNAFFIYCLVFISLFPQIIVSDDLQTTDSRVTCFLDAFCSWTHFLSVLPMSFTILNFLTTSSPPHIFPFPSILITNFFQLTEYEELYICCILKRFYCIVYFICW